MQENQNPKLYNICSGNYDTEVSILFNIKKDGELTPPLSRVDIGDKIWITQVQGKFIFNNEPTWWIATGTGIAPFCSMLKSGKHPLRLIHGGRLKTDMYFSNVFEELNSYVKYCSQDTGKDIYEGRLTKCINELKEIPSNINYYLCGSTNMVVDVRNLLISLCKKTPNTALFSF